MAGTRVAEPELNTTALIGVDWGTSSLRAYRMSADGTVLETKASDDGILSVPGGRFEAALLNVAGDWLSATTCPVVLSGMITSRQGWVEVPYAACPAGKTGLAAALHRHRLADGREVDFISGLSVIGADGVPDVMRGEETQIVGAMAEDCDDGLLVLPGTHSKWALTSNSEIVRFATFMTGELFAVLSQHSILGRMMEGDAHDEAAFIQGVAYGRRSDDPAGGLLKRLFGTRAQGLFGAVSAKGAASYLSGLLIGCEIREALQSLDDTSVGAPVTVLGTSNLTALYMLALGQLGVDATQGPAGAAAKGQHAIAETAGLL